MLRGPQTAGELRISCERLHSFSDISAVDGFLQELAARPAGALVVQLPRLPGARENRWAHLLSGPPAIEPVANSRKMEAQAHGSDEVAALKANIARIEAEMAAMRALLERIRSQLGVPPQ
jgi:uncharacterized protein YceH (UPF0502 family)